MIPLYFDPGTGAMIVQFLVAIGASIVLFYNKIKQFFLSFFSQPKKNEDIYENINVDEHSNPDDKQ